MNDIYRAEVENHGIVIHKWVFLGFVVIQSIMVFSVLQFPLESAMLFFGFFCVALLLHKLEYSIPILVIAIAVSEFVRIPAGPFYLHLPRLILILVLTVFLFRSLLLQKLAILKSKLDTVVLLYLLMCFISVFVSQFPLKSLKSTFNMVSLALFFWLTLQLLRTRSMVNIFIHLWIWVSTGVAVLAILEFSLLRQYRVVSIFEDPNFLGNYLLIGTLLLYALVSQRSLAGNPKSFLALVVHLIAVMLTLSRGAWLGLVVGILFVGYVNKNFWKTLALCVLIPAALILLSPEYVGSRIIQTLQLGERSAILHLYLNLTSLNMIKSNPILGIGMGTFEIVHQNYIPADSPAIIRLILQSRYAPHNTFLEIWSGIGTIGFILFIGIFAIAVKEALRTLREVRAPSRQAYLKGTVSALIAVLIHNLTLSYNREHIWILLAIVWAISYLYREEGTILGP
ncbi:MAG: hypothetical protein AYK18_16185 [Theionarchaea archaeon DG-70]|nr:MAG: hypothetical protein AM326_06155 [Candidatus Thorarchaeota archaeon SMTZ-45]KYK32155.1 MAG: hypothetical protein AYK18_16185 [Theionarchaea archaeon DG-70]